MTDLSNLILARLRSKGDRAVALRDLAGLSDRVGLHAKSRHVDQALQRMRRAGKVTWTRKDGWNEAPGARKDAT